ncbi:hypothetical protein CBS101457_003969 [Exobasidium rhododendri]|nr:hypothetical protein CBS101457_003969 [Exobasidium rhododendri]
MASAWLPSVPPWSATDKSSFAYLSVAQRWPTIITSAIDALYQASYALSYSSDQQLAEKKSEEAKVIIERLSKLKHDMGRDRSLETLGEDGGDGTEEYDQVINEHHWTWFTAPWLFAECYLYRLLRSFFARSTYWKDYDPFSNQKTSAFKSSAVAIEQLSATAEELFQKAEESQSQEEEVYLEAMKVIFRELVQTSLWGNATDLSLLTHLSHADIQTLQAGGVGAEAQSKRQHFILSGLQGVDLAWEAIVRGKGRSSQVDIILDNSGFELFTDLLLADFLIVTGLVEKVRFHPKDMPWFVSDVTPSDFLFTIEALQSGKFFDTLCSDSAGEEGNEGGDVRSHSGLDKSYFVDARGRSVSPSRSFTIDSNSVLDTSSLDSDPTVDGGFEEKPHNSTQRLASRWANHIKTGSFVVSIPFDTPLGGSPRLQKTTQANFWTSYHNYPSLPLAAPILFQQLQKSTLIISKGDLNYRKWCSDARWDFDEPFENVLGPVKGKINLLVLRTNKADVCVGVPTDRLASLDDEDAKWRTNGKYAMVEYVSKGSAVDVNNV